MPEARSLAGNPQKNVDSAMPTRKLAQDAHQDSHHRMSRKCTRPLRSVTPPVERITPTPTIPKMLKAKAICEQLNYLPFDPRGSTVSGKQVASRTLPLAIRVTI
ncbi:MAG TPA: hypothetical protein VKJ47_20685 [Candidatus Binatia bacterium]|nr:hypothetical protein [Candidatus Binatia bacterium]